MRQSRAMSSSDLSRKRRAILAMAWLLLSACATTTPSTERVQIVTAEQKDTKCRSLGTFTVHQRGGPDKPSAVLREAMGEVSTRGGNAMFIISNTVDWENGAALTGEALQCQRNGS